MLKNTLAIAMKISIIRSNDGYVKILLLNMRYRFLFEII